MNVSTLSLTTGLKLKQPFQIIKDDGSETSEMVNLEREKTCCLLKHVIRNDIDFVPF